MEKGMIFSIDAMIAFFVLLIALLGFAVALANYESRVHLASTHFYLEEKTIMAADSFVKNRSNENAIFGTAIKDYEKRRIKSNELSIEDSTLFSEYSEKNGFFVKKIVSNTKVLFESSSEGKECFSVRRFVLINSKKQIIEFTGCLIEN
jgi:hypothetical protein